MVLNPLVTPVTMVSYQLPGDANLQVVATGGQLSSPKLGVQLGVLEPAWQSMSHHTEAIRNNLNDGCQGMNLNVYIFVQYTCCKALSTLEERNVDGLDVDGKFIILD